MGGLQSSKVYGKDEKKAEHYIHDKQPDSVEERMCSLRVLLHV